MSLVLYVILYLQIFFMYIGMYREKSRMGWRNINSALACELYLCLFNLRFKDFKSIEIFMDNSLHERDFMLEIMDYLDYSATVMFSWYLFYIFQDALWDRSLMTSNFFQK